VQEKSPTWDRNLALDFHRCYRGRLPSVFRTFGRPARFIPVPRLVLDASDIAMATLTRWSRATTTPASITGPTGHRTAACSYSRSPQGGRHPPVQLAVAALNLAVELGFIATNFTTLRW